MKQCALDNVRGARANTPEGAAFDGDALDIVIKKLGAAKEYLGDETALVEGK